MKRTTIKDLDALVLRLNTVTKSPLETWIKVDGKLVAQIGNYHLDGAYGGWKLSRIVGESGGDQDVLRCGYVSKPELYRLIYAFIQGIEVE